MSKMVYYYSKEDDMDRAGPDLDYLVAIYGPGTPYPILRIGDEYRSVGTYVILKQPRAGNNPLWMGCMMGDLCFSDLEKPDFKRFTKDRSSQTWTDYGRMVKFFDQQRPSLMLAAPMRLLATKEHADLLNSGAKITAKKLKEKLPVKKTTLAAADAPKPTSPPQPVAETQKITAPEPVPQPVIQPKIITAAEPAPQPVARPQIITAAGPVAAIAAEPAHIQQQEEVHTAEVSLTDEQRRKLDMFDTVVSSLKDATNYIEQLKRELTENTRETTRLREDWIRVGIENADLIKENTAIRAENEQLKHDQRSMISKAIEDSEAHWVSVNARLKADYDAKYAAVESKAKEYESVIAEMRSKVNVDCDRELADVKTKLGACNTRVEELDELTRRMDVAGEIMEVDRNELVEQYKAEKARFDIEMERAVAAHQKLKDAADSENKALRERIELMAAEIADLKKKGARAIPNIDYDAPIGRAQFI